MKRTTNLTPAAAAGPTLGRVVVAEAPPAAAAPTEAAAAPARAPARAPAPLRAAPAPIALAAGGGGGGPASSAMSAAWGSLDGGAEVGKPRPASGLHAPTGAAGGGGGGGGGGSAEAWRARFEELAALAEQAGVDSAKVSAIRSRHHSA